MTYVLVATYKTQGARSSDFCFMPEGELVYYGVNCDKDGNDPDGPCGCLRSLCGVSCHRGTTTVIVQEVALSPEAVLMRYEEAYADARLAEIWPAVKVRHRRLLDLAATYPVGTVLERRGDDQLIVRETAE